MNYLGEKVVQLQTTLQALFGIEIPIFIVYSDWPKVTRPTIIASGHNFGDSYGGSSSRTESLTFELPRADKPFKLSYTLTICESAGQCDEDTLRLEGATPAEVAALKPVFFPSGNYGSGDQRPYLYVDGIELPIGAVG